MLVFKHLIDFLFPLYCLSCKKKGSLLCERCAKNLPRKTELHCPHCQSAITPNGILCHACSGKNPLDGVFSASPFRDPLIAKCIHTYKYSFAESLARPLGIFIADELRRTSIPLPDMMLFVPLHTWRLQWRGFNQAQRLAHIIGDTLAPELDLIPKANPLIRCHFTLPQSRQKNKKARKENLKNAFRISDGTPKDFFRNKRVWLVDDVATTGHTLRACATLLKKYGAREVYGITLAS
jgi:competence protein ComFC